MSASSTIKAVIKTKLLTPQLLNIPSRGATNDEIHHEEESIGHRFRSDHVELLRNWNGIDLEVIRIFGCGAETGGIDRISQSQTLAHAIEDQFVVIGSDPAGFVYLQAIDGRILTFDTDGGSMELSATDLDDFFKRLVFGPDAEQFAGPDWFAQLRDVGLVR